MDWVLRGLVVLILLALPVSSRSAEQNGRDVRPRSDFRPLPPGSPGDQQPDEGKPDEGKPEEEQPQLPRDPAGDGGVVPQSESSDAGAQDGSRPTSGAHGLPTGRDVGTPAGNPDEHSGTGGEGAGQNPSGANPSGPSSPTGQGLPTDGLGQRGGPFQPHPQPNGQGSGQPDGQGSPRGDLPTPIPNPTSDQSPNPSDPSNPHPNTPSPPSQQPQQPPPQPPQIPQMPPGGGSPGGGGGGSPGGGGGGSPGGGGGGAGLDQPEGRGPTRDPNLPETPGWLAAQLANESARMRASMEHELAQAQAEVGDLSQRKKDACAQAAAGNTNNRYYAPGYNDTMGELCKCLTAYESARSLAADALQQSLASWDRFWGRIKKTPETDLAAAFQALACSIQGGDCWEQWMRRQKMLGNGDPGNPTRDRTQTPCRDPAAAGNGKPAEWFPWADGTPASRAAAPSEVTLPLDLCAQAKVLSRAQKGVGREHSAVIRRYFLDQDGSPTGAHAVDNIQPGHLTGTRINDSNVPLKVLRDALLFHTHPQLAGGVPTFSGPDFATTVQSPAAGHLLAEGDQLFLLVRTGQPRAAGAPSPWTQDFRDSIDATWRQIVARTAGTELDKGRAAVLRLANAYGYAYYEGSGCTLHKKN